MAMETQIGALMQRDNLDANKILSELLNAKDIDMKTHICDPVTFSILQSTINNFESLIMINKTKKKQLPTTTKFLNDVLDYLKKFLVSWNRLSREEVTKTLQATKEEGSGAKSLFQEIAGLNK